MYPQLDGGSSGLHVLPASNGATLTIAQRLLGGKRKVKKKLAGHAFQPVQGGRWVAET